MTDIHPGDTVYCLGRNRDCVMRGTLGSFDRGECVVPVNVYSGKEDGETVTVYYDAVSLYATEAGACSALVNRLRRKIKVMSQNLKICEDHLELLRKNEKEESNEQVQSRR